MQNPSTTCPLANCPRKEACLRHYLYLKASAESVSFAVLNVNMLHPGPDGCGQFLIPRDARMAYGFRHLADTIPTGNARHIRWGDLFSSESTYYRTKRGTRPITPAEQEAILQRIKEAGGNPNVGFDRYEDIVIHGQP